MNPFRRRKHQPYSLGAVPVITARLLIIDPGWLPDDLVHELNAQGRGIILDVDNDGGYDIFRNADGSHTID